MLAILQKLIATLLSLTALFITVVVEQWLAASDHTPALIGAGASVLCLLLFGPERFLIPAMLLITLVLTLFRNRITAGKKVEP